MPFEGKVAEKLGKKRHVNERSEKGESWPLQV